MSLRKLDVVVVGAGFSGLYLLHKLRSSGFTVGVFEKGDQLGGTWHWNRYPGARCDIPSLQYSYQFDEELQQEWKWSEKYSAQPEILDYLNHVADRFDLKKDIEFNTEVISATFDEEKSLWLIQTSNEKIEAKFCVMATGCLSAPNTPDFEGLDDFQGQLLHTGKWPQSPVDFTDETVAIIGTGSSSIQSIPVIAEQAKHLYVFQRTANYSIPSNNGPMDPAEDAEVKSRYSAFRKENWENGFGIAGLEIEALATESTEQERFEKFNNHWEKEGLGFLGAYADLMIDKEANEMAASFVRTKVKEIVKDPGVAELLSPKFTIGCKRLCVDTGYFEAFNRDNVTLIDLNSNPIERITEQGLIANKEYLVDSLILATGFDAMTGALTRIDIQGRRGIKLKDQWKNGAKSYLGLGISNFPNLFTVTGPGSPSVLSNMVPSLELHVEWISQCIEWMRDNNKNVIESTKAVEDEWMVLVNEVADQTVYKSCNSWYNGSNIEEKAKDFLPFIGVPPYTEKITEVAEQNYQGFVFDKTN
ncbi:MAG: cyclohexanone monooxygenase [Gammaproteobacteria bacterium]|nr:cyclohexanone monooxygenase [Gammaproteobacteria bacterium]